MAHSSYFWVLLIIATFGLVDKTLSQPKFSKHISTAQRIASHGYPTETHYAETPDNYVLTLYRIPYSHKLQNQNERRPVALLLHGMFSCSDGYILNGPDSSLAYNVADAGYDVWLGNVRGTYYSRNNTKVSLNHPYFWRFSWHEIGFYDVPTMIDYALEVSGETTLHYIGHSQGTTIFLVAMSTRPEYNAKIKTAHLLAPTAYMEHVTDPMFTTLSRFLGHDGPISAFFGSQEFLPHNSLFIRLGYTMCGEHSPDLRLCSLAAVILEGYAPNANVSMFPIVAETHPGGASTDQTVHYMQSISTGLFRRFDYGARRNILKYNQPTPPAYDTTRITAALYLYYSDNDNLAVEPDVLKLAGELPNLQKLHHVSNPTWAHADFTWAVDARQEINIPVIEAMDAYEAGNQ